MQIRCTTCARTVAIGPRGDLPGSCPHCAGACVPPQFGPFVPQRLLATGGMGEVYLARHAELGTEVALKLLPAMAADAAVAMRERFAREARLTAKVAHPGVVKVLASDMAGDRPYLVLELVAGETLRQRLLSGPLPVAEAARLAAATADVLAAAHAQGVLHRDVKPDNVMVTPAGAVRVLDFGIARAIGDEAPLTRTGEIVGTPEYMAPEQLLEGPEATDARTDVHALGLLLYELLTGRSPFHGANLFQALKLVEALVPPPPSSQSAAVPAALDAVAAKALQKDPANRFADAAAFAAAVRAAVPELEATIPAAPASRAARWLAAVALLLAAALGTALLRPRPAPVDPEHAPRIASAPPVAPGEAIDVLLAAGRWSEALVLAERAAGDEPGLRERAQHAFVLTHVAWPMVLETPQWLCACDERQRHRLFGDALEPDAPRSPLEPAHRALLAGAAPADHDAPQGGGEMARRLAALGRHLAGGTEPAPALADDALGRLLAIRALPHEARADAFAAWALRLPLQSPEHWLARLAERHWRGDHTAAQAAETAWWSGAGELAVLLDAALALRPPGEGARLRSPGPAAWATLRRRVGAAAPDDTPAAPLLLALLDAVVQGREALEVGPVRAFPEPWRTPAAAWFVAAARDAGGTAVPLLTVAAALGRAPEDSPPWSELPDTVRAELRAEATRGR